MGSENPLIQVQIKSCSFGLSYLKQDDPVTIEENGNKHVIWLTMQWLIAIQESNYFTIQNTSFRTLSWSSMRYMYSTKFDSFQNDKSFQSDKRQKREKYAMVTVFPAWDGAHPVVPNVLTNPLSPASCSTSVASLTDTATLRTAQSARASLTLRRPRLCNKIATWHPYFRTTPSRLSVINWENGFWRPKWHLRGWSLYCFANYILRQFSNDFYSIWHSSELWAPL